MSRKLSYYRTGSLKCVRHFSYIFAEPVREVAYMTDTQLSIFSAFVYRRQTRLEGGRHNGRSRADV